MLSEISQSGKDKYHVISLICEMNTINKQNRNKLVDSENRLSAVRGKGNCRGWVKKVQGLSKLKKNLIGTDNSMVITREKGGGGGRREYRGINGDGRRRDLGW